MFLTLSGLWLTRDASFGKTLRENPKSHRVAIFHDERKAHAIFPRTKITPVRHTYEFIMQIIVGPDVEKDAFWNISNGFVCDTRSSRKMHSLWRRVPENCSDYILYVRMFIPLRMQMVNFTLFTSKAHKIYFIYTCVRNWRRELKFPVRSLLRLPSSCYLSHANDRQFV